MILVRPEPQLEKAIKALSEKSRENQQQQQQQKRQNQNKQEQKRGHQDSERQKDESNLGRDKKTEAPDTTVQQILDKEKRQRKQRQLRRARGGYKKVEKDW